MGFNSGFKGLMMYKTIRALFWDPYKTLNAKQALRRIFYYYTWWYI